MPLLIVVLAGFLLAAIAAPVQRRLGEVTRWLLAAGPALLFAYFLAQAPTIVGGQMVQFSSEWAPQLGVNFALRLDGLSLLFALLVTGVGTLVVIYNGDYLRGYTTLGRFQAYTLLFMAAMLGVVLANDLITLYIFWELTSITSYLLIGFYHDEQASRDGALKALLITSGGGLALLAGLVLLGLAGDTLQIGQIVVQGDVLRSHALYTPILLLFLLGAFTKSAQMPFHIWLPDAMQAPAGASAYLHSATMVKAGIYLLARFQPALGGTEQWHLIVGLVGLVTMLAAGYIALAQNDLKAMLAYSTISSLGWLVALLGIGTNLALKALMVGIVAHALYKAALFLLVGVIEKQTGTRDLRQLGGLFRALPVTAVLTIVAVLSMAGLPPLLGFVAKETLLEAALDVPAQVLPYQLVVAVAVGASIFTLAYGLIIIFGVFLGQESKPEKSPREAPWTMLLAPAILALFSLVLALPPFLQGPTSALMEAATSVSLGEPYGFTLALWHGITLPLLLTIGVIAGGSILYLVRTPVRTWQSGWPARIRLSILYDGTLVLLNRTARRLTGFVQSGTLRDYLLMILGAMIVLVGYALVSGADPIVIPPLFNNPPLFELVGAGLMIIAIIFVSLLRARLGAIASLGAVGLLITLIYVIYSGPDLALTQLLVETLTLVLLLVVFYFLPRFFEERSSGLGRLRDVAIASGVGGLVMLLTLMVLGQRPEQLLPDISQFYMEQSLPAAHGANVVNVILVDFRALDTMGEITVLLIAMLGIFALLKLRVEEPQEPENALPEEALAEDTLSEETL